MLGFYKYYLIGIVILSIIGFIVYKIRSQDKHKQPIQPQRPQPSMPITSPPVSTIRSLRNPQPELSPVIETEVPKVDVQPVVVESKPLDIPEPKEEIFKDGPFNALVFDRSHRGFGLRRITMLPGKNYGQTYTRDNCMVFLLEQSPEGDLKPLVFSENIKNTPGELYEALQTEEDVRILFGSRANAGDKFKLWLFILGIIVVLIIGFMSTQAGKGG